MINTSTPKQRRKTQADYLWAEREGFGRHVCVWGREWRRGFVESITLSAEDFREHIAEILKVQPIREVRITTPGPLFPIKAKSPVLLKDITIIQDG
jgi:hypothetical protein